MIEIKLSQRGKNKGKYVTFVDDKYEYLTKLNWYADERLKVTYAARRMGFGKERLHRVILSEMLQRLLLDSEEVDHIDGNGLNNLESNLRLANHAENQRNVGLRSDNASKIRGVSWDKFHGKWKAVISVNGKQFHLGCSTELEEAADKYHKEFKNYG